MKGVLPYNEAVAGELAEIGEYRQTGREVKLHFSAVAAWRSLQGNASTDKVMLVPISGFRTLAYQKVLFARAVSKYGSEEAAVRWVARPGLSEHHTGLALDIGDADHPECDVELAFEETPAFAWLQNNAARYGFEMSFPRDNVSGVDYEPWHWRFVATSEAKQVFER